MKMIHSQLRMGETIVALAEERVATPDRLERSLVEAE